jgi:diguanylate cyclase (GGDEF)-like protein
MKNTCIQNATILIIDDNPTNLNILSNCLTTMGAKVLVQKDGASGIDCAIRKQPDIILLDILMPGIDGFETCRQLKVEATTEAIPVIFSSALVDTVDKLKGFELGAVDYITLPIQVDEVLARIETHLRVINLQKQLELANKRLHKLCITDELTQIPNRRQFDGYLEQEWLRAIREHRPIALVLVDIDLFKQYNDTYGHQAGDDCLKLVASTLENTLKRPADLVARYGGEEFAIVLPNTPESGAAEICKEICEAIFHLNIPHKESPYSNFLTISLGCNISIPENGNELKDFIKAADNNLYQAKGQGRNKFIGPVCV